MVNATDLLGQLLRAGMSGGANERVGHAMGPQGLGRSGSPLGDVLGGLLGGGSGGGLGSILGGRSGAGAGAGSGGGLGGMFGGGNLSDVANRAEQMFPGAGRTLQDPKQLQIGSLAALAGAVLGGRQGGMGGAVGGGLLALLGSLAFSAWKNRDATGGSATPQTAEELAREAPLGLREPQSPQEEAQLEQTALLAIRAMINAAKADGAIDGAEMGKIMGKLKEFGSDDEARDFVMSELQKPFDLDSLVAGVNSRELAVQVYGASLLAIEVDTPAEREYLQNLADKLGLDKETVCYIHETLGVAT